MKRWIQEKELDPSGQFDDYDILRFCRARKFHIAEVQKMFENFIMERRKHNVDAILSQFTFPELD